MRVFDEAARARALAVVNRSPMQRLPRPARDADGGGRVSVLQAARTNTEREIHDAARRRTALLLEARSLTSTMRSLNAIARAATKE
jgi:hypothetical protein